MTTVFKLAHISDLHLGPMPAFWPWHWNLKRAIGYANWVWRRHRLHLPRVADRLVEDLKAQDVDHIAVTGDLANIGMPSEHAQAAAWLQRLGGPRFVSVIPGNHDIYTPLRSDIGVRRWADYMRGWENVAETGSDGDNMFPYVRIFDAVALIGVNSAIPTAIGSANGRVGQEQLTRLGRVLVALGEAGACRVVMVHHPPLPGDASPARGLFDARELEDVLIGAGAELVIHGHNHRNMLSFRTGPTGAFPVVGVPSLSAAPGSHAPGAYNLYEISRGDDGYTIVLCQRRIGADGRLIEVEDRRLLHAASDSHG